VVAEPGTIPIADALNALQSDGPGPLGREQRPLSPAGTAIPVGTGTPPLTHAQWPLPEWRRGRRIVLTAVSPCSHHRDYQSVIKPTRRNFPATAGPCTSHIEDGIE
jgi:hypothetical protein